MARKLKTIATWINENTRLRATVVEARVNTDRPKPRGQRFRTHVGQGRSGFTIQVCDGDSVVFEHCSAETYRKNSEVEEWLAKWLEENPMTCPELTLTKAQIALAKDAIAWLNDEGTWPPGSSELPGYAWWRKTDLCGDEDGMWAAALKAALERFNGMNDYWVEVRYVVKGQLRVSALDKDAAIVAVLEEMTFPGTCELADWEVLEVRETDRVDEHGRPVKS